MRLTKRPSASLLLAGAILAGCASVAPPSSSRAPSPSPSTPPHCLIGGFWLLDPTTFNRFLVGLAANETIRVLPATGSIELFFDEDGQASVAAEDFAAGITYDTASADGDRLTVVITVIGNGLSVADYALADDTSDVVGGADGEIAFSNVIGGLKLEAEITINNQPTPVPVELPLPFGAGNASYTCDPLHLNMVPPGVNQTFTYERVDAPDASSAPS